MPKWRTSTWLYLIVVVIAIGAEVVYAVNGDTDLQGHALAYLAVISVLFLLYRLATRGRSARGDSQ